MLSAASAKSESDSTISDLSSEGLFLRAGFFSFVIYCGVWPSLPRADFISLTSSAKEIDLVIFLLSFDRDDESSMRV